MHSPIDAHQQKEWQWHPLTPALWGDFERLFGPKGAYGGCWCMWWRITRGEFERQQGEGNRQAMQTIVASGELPGILLYDNGRPVGWCSVAPRDRFASLNRSRVLKPIDGTPVWSIVCLFVARGQRNRGVMRRLIAAAVEYACENGATVIEAYPTLPKQGRLPPVSSFMGLPADYQQLGFVECRRPSTAKVIMRYSLNSGV